eukprot:192226-Alexandrium_andersonii.AAC.1
MPKTMHATTPGRDTAIKRTAALMATPLWLACDLHASLPRRRPPRGCPHAGRNGTPPLPRTAPPGAHP